MKLTPARIVTWAGAAWAGFALALALSWAPPAAAAPTCWTGYHGQFFTSIQYCVSSVRAPEEGATFGPANLANWDGGTTTTKAWCEGAADFGLGETITIRVDGGPAFRRILMANGYAKSPAAYANNARVKTVEVTGDNGLRATLQFPDRSELGHIDLPAKPQRWVQFKIVDVYPGKQAANTCLGFIMPDFEYEEELLMREQGLIK